LSAAVDPDSPVINSGKPDMVRLTLQVERRPSS